MKIFHQLSVLYMANRERDLIIQDTSNTFKAIELKTFHDINLDGLIISW